MKPAVPVDGTSGNRQMVAVFDVADADAADVAEGDAVDAGVPVSDGVAPRVIDVGVRLAPQPATMGTTSRASSRVLSSGTVEHPHDGARRQVLGEGAGRVVHDPDVQHGRRFLCA